MFKKWLGSVSLRDEKKMLYVLLYGRGLRIPVFVSGTWILDSKCDSGFLSCILDSEAQDSGFHKQKFPGFQKPDFLLTFGEVEEGLK